ncbi:hypothetical protein AKJ09_09512 [Labilithrix luteola]|uniref:PEGA domain-containing protein n=1 Tax=Labilithrix luteola TaxID=1391654 RepID=A0A0K1QAT3_9BACT|nr:tetratricopeptide repeat protein [Labilithrix luteola]AKV02849.1 hypothetical protein AKJ09_09512 [Labilithrix luteola]
MKRRTVMTIALVLAPATSWAAGPQKNGPNAAAAQSLFYEARALMKDGRYTEACPKLEESLKLDDGIGTRFNLADCNEHLGKVATAWASFLDVAALSKANNQLEREKVARKRAQALEPRLPKLTIEVDTVAAIQPGLEVTRDGSTVGTAAWGTPIPVDPGSHKIVARANGKQPWEEAVEAVEGKTAKVTLPRELTPIVVAATPPPAPAQASVGAPASRLDTASTTTLTSEEQAGADFPPPVIESHASAQRTVGWVIGAAGIAGLGVGAAFGIRSLDKRNNSRDNCVGDLCNETGVKQRDQAINAGNIATYSTIFGGAALVTGIILVLTTPAEKQGSASGKPRSLVGSIRAVPEASPYGGGVVLTGALP